VSVVRRIVGIVVALLALTAVSLLGLGALYAPDLRMPAGTRGRSVELGSLPVRVVQAGSGPDLLLIHGSPGSIEDWEPVFERLAARYRVTAYDRPGHGFSGGWTLPHTPVENARVGLALIRALQLKDVVVVGHSYGGTTALAMAVENPRELKAVVVVGSQAYRFPRAEPVYRALSLPVFGPGFARAFAPFIGRAKIEEGVRRAFAPNEAAMPAGFVDKRVPLWTRPSEAVSLAQERTTFEASAAALSPRYAGIHKPLFIVEGAEDRGSLDSAQRLSHDVPGARLVLLPDTGHYVQYARPDELIRTIDEAAAN
jgi:pimeloyl-ACP methyl ester carboxylesterase